MTCSIAASGPLVVVQPAFTCSTAPARPLLDTPLFAHVSGRELLTLAYCLDAAMERCERVRGAGFMQHKQRQRLEELCKQIAPQLPAEAVLSALGLLEQFPYLAKAFSSGQHFYGAPAQQPGVSYLSYVNLLNQVVMMGTQLYNDAGHSPHHKYSAHQIALLYQALNMLQGDTKPIRRCIESRFDDLKIITESAKPVLPVDVAAWMQEMTWTCREEVAVCPPYIHKRLQPLATLAAGGAALKV